MPSALLPLTRRHRSRNARQRHTGLRHRAQGKRGWHLATTGRSGQSTDSSSKAARARRAKVLLAAGCVRGGGIAWCNGGERAACGLTHRMRMEPYAQSAHARHRVQTAARASIPLVTCRRSRTPPHMLSPPRHLPTSPLSTNKPPRRTTRPRPPTASSRPPIRHCGLPAGHWAPSCWDGGIWFGCCRQ